MKHALKLALVLWAVLTTGSHAGDYYVSTTGSDTNPGTLAEPFATIQHAVGVLVAGDTCHIRGGTYHEEVVGSNLSGTAANPITIKNYQDEQVTLDGTVPITGSWTQHSGNIYKINIPQDIWQLFYNDEMMVTCRWPNEPDASTLWNADETWGQSDQALSSNGTLYDLPTGGNDLAASGLNVQGAIAVMNLGNWESYCRVVDSHTAGSGNFFVQSGHFC